jgi:gliding motility-associated-like protein
LTVTNPISCHGVCDGIVQVVANGGTPPYTYAWSNGNSGITANNVCAGWLFVTVTDANSCKKVDSINVTQPNSIQISFINVTQVNCHGDCSGQATAQAIGGTGAYTYQWDASAGNQTTATADSLCPGFHSITVTDANHCTNSNSVNISDTSHLSLNIVLQQNPSCFGLCDGAITVAASGGYPPYAYLWNTGATTPGIINLCADTFYVTVTDDSLCSRSLQIILTNPPLLDDSISIDHAITCNSVCDGIVTVHAFGGNGTYSYQWDDLANSTTASVSNLCVGTYHVTITVGGTCTKVDSITISEPNAITNTFTILQPISCHGQCNAAVQASASGGTPPYAYQWDFGFIGNPDTNLCPGVIHVTITDANLCKKVDSINITQPDSITIMLSSTPVACSGNCTGTAVALITGGTPPYTYKWDAQTGNQTGPIADSLCLGTYHITITDSNGCTKSDSVSVSDTSHLTINIILQQDPLCNGSCNGAITVAGTGGYPPYTYTWDNGLPSQPNQINLCAHIAYTVTVTDDSLCKRWTSITLNNPPSVDDSIITIQPISCNGACNGSVSVAPFGGTGSFTYQWDDPLLSHTDTISFLCAGLYHVTISDANGCSKVDSVSLQEPTVLTVNLSVNQAITCYGSCNGIADAIVNGGTPPYQYLWSNGDVNNSADSLCAGWVHLTITDANFCQKVDSINMTQPDSISLSFTTTVATCGGNNGTATVVATGGTGSYSYQWDANAHNQTTDIADSLSVNIYSVTVSDANGCTAVGNVSIIDTSNLSLTITNIHNITCAGSCDGSATASVTGGYPPYTYLWNTTPAQTDSIASNLCVGTYTVTVVDDSLCSRVDTVNINNATILAVQDSIIPIACTGLCDASIILIPSGGTPPYVSYAWSIPGLTDSIATGLCAGTYYYSVTDANNCVVSDSVTIVDPGQMAVTINVLQSLLCHGYCNGSLALTITGANGLFTYLWSNGSTDSVLVNLCADTYNVTVTGQGTCVSTASYTLTAPDSLQITYTNILHVACGGDCSGRVTALVSGGTPPYIYQWDANAGNATTPTIDSLCANLYDITVTDQNGCTLISSFEVTDTSHLILQIIDSSMVTCFGRCDGLATAQAQNGYPPYNYLWNTNPQQHTAIADSLCAGPYRVTVTDDSLCSRVRPITITQPDSLYLSIKDSSLIHCFGDCTGSITVTPNGGTQPYVIQWSNSLLDTTITQLCAGLYVATLTDAHNCMDSLHYFVSQPIGISDSLNIITALCSSGSNDGSVTVTITGGVLPYQILWNTGDTLTHLDSLSSGTYYYTVTDANGCKKQDSALIHPMIVVHATAKKDTTICYGDSVQIFGFGGAVYFWTPGQGLSDSTAFDPYAKPTQTTTYYFTVFDSICFDIDSVTIGVYPQFTLDAGQNQTILYEHSTQLNGTCSDPSVTFLWIPSTGLEDSSNAVTIAHPLQTTTYYLFATNANGCLMVDSVTITVVPKIRVPSGLTPNGDGINDTWVIDLIELFPNCEVMIFNRWGEKLFYSKGYPASDRWDGTYKGKPLPVGTYYYIINLHDEAYPDPITGPITIMR